MKNFSSYVKLLVTVSSIIALALLSGCGGGGGNASTAVTLNSIAITPTSLTVTHGGTANLKAIGTFSDGSTADLTSQVTWTAAAPGTAAVSTKGEVSGVAIGSATVTATFKGVTSPSVSITVTTATLSSIAITPTATNLAKGANSTLTAIGTYSDGSSSDISTQVTWTSASPATATVGSNTGTVTAVAVGSTTVSASLSGITSPDAGITVTAATLGSITIPSGATLAKGTNSTLSATGTYSDGTTSDLTTQVTWTSADLSTATVGSHTGSVIGSAVGTTTVTAALNGITSNTSNIHVIAATLSGIAIAPVSVSLAKGTNANLAATGTYSDGSTATITAQVNWTSVAPATASVGANTGVVLATAVGSTSISASLNAVNAPSISVTVTPAVLTGIALTPSPVSLAKFTSTNLTATGTYSDSTTADITTQATWTSAAPATATVGINSGVVTGVAEGSTSVSAALNDISSPTVGITVTPAIYATWNPADKGPSVTLDGTNLTASSPREYESVRATIGISSGTAFWEITPISGPPDGNGVVGIMSSAADVGHWISYDPSGWGLYFYDGALYGSSGKNPGWVTTTVADGSVVGFGLDMDAGTLRIWVDGVDKGIAFTGLTGTIYPATTVFTGGISANFGATSFAFPQTGYDAGVYQH